MMSLSEERIALPSSIFLASFTHEVYGPLAHVFREGPHQVPREVDETELVRGRREERRHEVI